MPQRKFFIGSGKLTIWYFLFYFLGLPLYILGIFLFSQLRNGLGPQGGEFVLSILAIGYLILGFFSMVNTILYVQKTKKLFLGSLLFLGLQIVFWMVGYGLGNNYPLLSLFFIISFFVVVYLNLKALSYVQETKLPSPHKKPHKN